MGATVKVADFSNVKERGNFNPHHVEAGDYAAVITKVEDGTSKKTDEFQYIFTFKLQKYSQYSYPYYCKLTENQLWKLRNVAVAAGLNVPKKRMKFDPNKVVGKLVGVTMEDDEYDGKMKSVIQAVFPAAELSDGAEIENSDEDDASFEEGATPVAAGDDDDSADEPEAEVKPKKNKKGKKDKKNKKKKGSEENMEELDISDLG